MHACMHAYRKKRSFFVQKKIDSGVFFVLSRFLCVSKTYVWTMRCTECACTNVCTRVYKKAIAFFVPRIDSVFFVLIRPDASTMRRTDGKKFIFLKILGKSKKQTKLCQNLARTVQNISRKNMKGLRINPVLSNALKKLRKTQREELLEVFLQMRNDLLNFLSARDLASMRAVCRFLVPRPPPLYWNTIPFGKKRHFDMLRFFACYRLKLGIDRKKYGVQDAFHKLHLRFAFAVYGCALNHAFEGENNGIRNWAECANTMLRVNRERFKEYYEVLLAGEHSPLKKSFRQCKKRDYRQGGGRFIDPVWGKYSRPEDLADLQHAAWDRKYVYDY
jgi:hypothetical protein